MSRLSPDAALECLQALDTGLLMLRRGGVVGFLNPRAEEILAVRSPDAEERPVWELLGVDERSPLGPDSDVWSAFVLPPTQIACQPGGRDLILECRLVPLGRTGRVDGGLLLFDDVSESEEERAFQRNVERFSSIGNLSAIVAHEIRNPLTGIRTTIQYVQSKLPEGSPLRESLTDSIHEIDRIEQFTTDLLQFARPKTTEMVETNVNELIQKVLDHVELQCRERGIQLKRELTEDLPLIPLDRDAVQQALLNIVLNAIDAMPEGGVLRVSSSKRRYRTRLAVEVAVADTGSGVPEEILERIYDPFFTTKGSGGTGLGLSIALQVMQEHGGRIYLRNRPQGGAIFRLSFRVPEEREAGGGETA